MNFRKISFNILAVMLVATVMLSAIAMPLDVSAASKKKAKCTISLQNINSDTVLKKGKKLKVVYRAVSSNGKKAKVRFKSSNRKIATVSRKGVIKAKKNGKVKITAYAYIKGKKCGKKTVTIKIGKPVSGISISGSKYVCAGKSIPLRATVSPKSATNKKVIWTSNNSSVVRVDQHGMVTGLGNGRAVITATAADGSGTINSVTVYSHKYTRSDTNWIAHRGWHENAVENTAQAFRLAGQAGFWGCECDIYETRHENDSFDIVINHDDTFKRVFGVNSRVRDLSASEIRANSRLSRVCFFDEYLNICAQYNMVPIIEIKDFNMSDEAISKFVDMVNEQGMLEEAHFISFDSDILERTQEYIINTYGVQPYTGYLIGGGDVKAAVLRAFNLHFTGVNIEQSLISSEINKLCTNYGLKICTWTYADNYTSYENMYKHIVTGQYNVTYATTDVKFFD